MSKRGLPTALKMRHDAHYVDALTSSAGTLANGYINVDTGAPPGQGIVGQTIQYHGTADRYATAGAQTIATLYSDPTTATSSPAVTMRSVGSAGGHAAAFSYDLARSIEILSRTPSVLRAWLAGVPHEAGECHVREA